MGWVLLQESVRFGIAAVVALGRLDAVSMMPNANSSISRRSLSRAFVRQMPMLQSIIVVAFAKFAVAARRLLAFAVAFGVIVTKTTLIKSA
jgi:hypothetical protein